MIDLKAAMAKKLETTKSAPTFKYETPGDQIVFIFHGQRTVPVSRGSKTEEAELVDCEILAGEKFDGETKKWGPVQPGPAVFFASTVLRRLLKENPLECGGTYRIQFVEMSQKGAKGQNPAKLYGIEILERASGNGSEPEENWPQ